MSNKIIEAGDLPLDEKVYLKKDFMGWRIVNPYRDSDDNLIMANVIYGGLRNLLTLIILLIAISGFIWVYNHDVVAIEENYKTIAANPIAWCKDVCKGSVTAAGKFPTDVNFSKLIIVDGGEN